MPRGPISPAWVVDCRAAVERGASIAMYFTYIESPVGTLLLAGAAEALRTIRLPADGGPAPADPAWESRPAAFRDGVAQLHSYFAGTLRRFELALAPVGTPFQLRVWRALLEIPYGETTSYGALARTLGAPGAARAVGLANGRNPLPIVIPCHRVIGGDGSLTGYGGGLRIKRFLLDLERGTARLF
jgi:methylated-DNA-[protein]-cysteine S-methyltransferase